jgi:hypothetical protein
MLTGGLLALAGCGGGTRVVTKTVTTARHATVSKPAPAPTPTPATGPSPAALAANHAAAATAIADDALQAASPLGAAVFVTAAATAAGTMSTATSAGAVTGHGGGAPAPKRVVSGQGSGEYAVAFTNGTFHHPSQIVLNVAASPPQTGSVDWNVVCFENSGGIGRKEGRETLQLPTTKTLPLPAPSSTCIGSANVQLSKSGTVTISISG